MAAKSKVVPGKKYTAAEIGSLVDQQTADHFRQKGYILRFDANERLFSLVPVTEAYRTATGSDHAPVMGMGVFDPLPPIVKRTPQQRLDSLMLRFIKDVQAIGTVPGLDDERITTITGEAFKAGRTEVTGEVVRSIASHFLTNAEKAHEAKLDKQITRHED